VASRRGSIEPSSDRQQHAADGRVEHRLGLPALARRQLPAAHPERVLQQPQLAEHGQVVGVVGDLQRAGLAEPRGQPCCALKLGRE